MSDGEDEDRAAAGGVQSLNDDAQVDFRNIRIYISDLAQRLLNFYPLYFVIVVVVTFLWLLSYLYTAPVFTAQATIGPPNPSPINSMLSTMNSAPSVSGVASRLLGGVTASGNDPFQEYQQLLESPRLAVELAEKDRFLQIIFYKNWDAKYNRWKPHGPLHAILVAVDHVLQRPVTNHPNVDMLEAYLASQLSVGPAEAVGKSAVVSMAGLEGPYLTLAFQAESPEKAVALLGTILQRDDDTIRQEQLKDVEARINYIEGELPRITQADQREALIQTLANQEQLKVMMVSDKRFSYVLVSMPYASPIPTSPRPPIKTVMLSFLISFVLWIFLVAIEPRVTFLRKWLGFFKRPRQVNA